MLAVSYSIGKELHCPDVIFGRLAGRELDFLRSLLGRYRANLQILAEDGAHRREKHLRVDALLRHALLVQVEVEFLIVILPPGELRIDEHFLDTPVRQQLGLQLLRPLIEFVVVVAVHPDAVGAGTLADVITEPLVLQSVDAPAAASQFQCLAYHIGFQCIGKTAVPGFLLKINLHTGTPGAVNGSMKLPDFLEPAEVGLHTFHQSVHLLEGAAIGKVGVGIEHHLLITGEVTAFVHLLYEKPQAAAQRLVHNGFHRLLIGIRTEYLIVSSFPFSPSFQFAGQQKTGRPKPNSNSRHTAQRQRHRKRMRAE